MRLLLQLHKYIHSLNKFSSLFPTIKKVFHFCVSKNLNNFFVGVFCLLLNIVKERIFNEVRVLWFVVYLYRVLVMVGNRRKN